MPSRKRWLGRWYKGSWQYAQGAINPTSELFFTEATAVRRVEEVLETELNATGEVWELKHAFVSAPKATVAKVEEDT